MQNRIQVEASNFFYSPSFNNSQFNLKLHSTGLNIEEILVQTDCMYFFLQSGSAEIIQHNCKMNLTAGMYFSVKNGAKIIIAPETKAISAASNGHICLNSFGGPVEDHGRLKYIDGCSDTLLLSPAKLGEPCLNLLHFPKNTKQTAHHHPSFRFGIVYSGSGQCVTEGRVDTLKSGDVFYIPALLKHKFDTTDDTMNIIAFHPDSDWGPTDEVHPMINRTII